MPVGLCWGMLLRVVWKYSLSSAAVERQVGPEADDDVIRVEISSNSFI